MIKLLKLALFIGGIASATLFYFVFVAKQKIKNNADQSAYQAPHSQTKEAFYENLGGKPWDKVVAKYMTKQAEQEATLKQEVFNILGIDEQKFNEYKAEFWPHYKISEKKQCCAVTARAKNEMCKHAPIIFDFLNEHDINVCYMNVIPTKEMGAAAATQSNLYIDDACILNKKDKDLTCLAKADILHEMQHVLHDDSFNIFVIKNLLLNHANNCPEKIAQYNELFSRFDKFREKRADILAGLVDPCFARVSADFYYQDVCQGIGDEPCDTHPTPATRHAYLDQLHKEMVKCLNTP